MASNTLYNRKTSTKKPKGEVPLSESSKKANNDKGKTSSVNSKNTLEDSGVRDSDKKIANKLKNWYEINYNSFDSKNNKIEELSNECISIKKLWEEIDIDKVSMDFSEELIKRVEKTEPSIFLMSALAKLADEDEISLQKGKLKDKVYDISIKLIPEYRKKGIGSGGSGDGNNNENGQDDRNSNNSNKNNGTPGTPLNGISGILGSLFGDDGTSSDNSMIPGGESSTGNSSDSNSRENSNSPSIVNGAMMTKEMLEALKALKAAREEEKERNKKNGGSEEDGQSIIEAIAPEELIRKVREYINELEAIYLEFDITESEPGKPIIEEEYPTLIDISFALSKLYELISKLYSTYDGYDESVINEIKTRADPKISKPGYYSFMDEIDQDINKVKHTSLHKMWKARRLLASCPWLYTKNPNRAREANRRARQLKKEIFKAIKKVPSMLDLWDGIGEWATPYITQNELDKSQLPIEKWGKYFGGSEFQPRITRESQFRKMFREDRNAVQETYNTTNDFFQYCLSNAYLTSEQVELGMDYEKTTTYKSCGIEHVGEKLKGDNFFHLIIQYIANPWKKVSRKIGLSKYLIEYIVHQIEEVEIKTYDLATRIDGRRLAVVDYRGYKRMNDFTKLDRSGLDVNNDE